jgi:hypothetical protein
VISESLCITHVVEAASLNGKSFSQRSNADATVQANQIATFKQSGLTGGVFQLYFLGGDSRRENFSQKKMYLYCSVVHIVAINEKLPKMFCSNVNVTL